MHRFEVASRGVEPAQNGEVCATFDEPQRAITPDQAVVFYDGDLVVAAGGPRKWRPQDKFGYQSILIEFRRVLWTT